LSRKATRLVKEGHPATLSVPNHKQVARGTLRSLIREAGLTIGEFAAAVSMSVGATLMKRTCDVDETLVRRGHFLAAAGTIVPRGSPMKHQSLIIRDADILGGVPIFAGTRVPVKTLFDYLKANHPLADFLDDFPTVPREQAQAVLSLSEQHWQEAQHEAAA